MYHINTLCFLKKDVSNYIITRANFIDPIIQKLDFIDLAKFELSKSYFLKLKILY